MMSGQDVKNRHETDKMADIRRKAYGDGPIMGLDGKEYGSVTAVCRAAGITPEAFVHGIGMGLTWQQALSRKVKGGHDEKLRLMLYGDESAQIVDHLGNPYPSFTAMCRAYGRYVQWFADKVQKGWPLEKALTAPTDRATPTVDPFGYRHGSVREMYRFYRQPSHLKKDAATPENMARHLFLKVTSPVRVSDGLTVVRQIDGAMYYDVLVNGEEETWTLHEIFQYINDNGISFSRRRKPVQSEG